MVSEFGGTLGCKEYLEIGQPHTGSKKTRPRDWSSSGRPRAKCCWMRQRPKYPRAHAQTMLWQRPTNALSTAVINHHQRTWSCGQPAAGDRWNQTSTTGASHLDPAPMDTDTPSTLPYFMHHTMLLVPNSCKLRNEHHCCALGCMAQGMDANKRKRRHVSARVCALLRFSSA